MPQKQIGFYGRFQPTGVDTSGAQRLQALAKVADQVGEIAFNIGAAKAQKAGQEAGIAEGIEAAKTGQAIESKETFMPTFFGESYNKSMKTAYLSQLSTDAKGAFDRFYAESPDDTEAFKSKADAYLQSTLQNVSEEFRPLVESDLQAYYQDSSTKVFAAEKKKNEQWAFDTKKAALVGFSDSMARYARDGNTELLAKEIVKSNTVIDQMVESGEIGIDDALELKKKNELRIRQQQVLGNVDRIIFDEDLTLEQQYNKGVEFLANVRENELTDIDPEDKDQLLAVVQGKLNTVRVAMEKEKATISQEDALTISNLEIAAKNNLRPAEEIIQEANDLFLAGKIKGEKRTSIINAALNVSETEVKKQNQILRVGNKISGKDDGQPIYQDDVDTYYSEFEKSLPTDESRTVRQAELVSQVRIVPKRMKQEVENDLLSGDPARIAKASDLIDRVNELPGMFNQLVSSDQQAFAKTVNNLSQVMTPEEAVQKAMIMTDPNNQDRIQAVEARIKKEKYADKYESWTDDALGDMPEIQKDRVTKQYQELFETYLKSGMSESDAKDSAERIIQNNWKEDPDFGFMQYPPMDYYAVGGDTSYILDQLYEDVTDNFAFSTGISKDNMYLISDTRTSRTASTGRPEYKVLVVDDNGQFEYVPGYWTPDTAKEADIQRKINEGEIEARRRRSRSRNESKVSATQNVMSMGGLR